MQLIPYDSTCKPLINAKHVYSLIFDTHIFDCKFLGLPKYLTKYYYSHLLQLHIIKIDKTVCVFKTIIKKLENCATGHL